MIQGTVKQTNQGSNLKQIFFELLFLLLKDENIPIYITGTFTLLQYCQILYFAFHPIIDNLWNSSIQPVLQQIFGTISLVYLFYNSSWTTFIAIFYVCVTIVACFLIVISYVMYCIQYQKLISKILINYLRLMVNMVLTFLYIPMLNTFIIVLKCTSIETDRNKTKNVLQYYNEVECWQTTHFLHGISAIIISSILVFITLIFGILYFDGIHNQKKINSKINNLQCISLIFYETLLILTYNFLDDKSHNIISISVFFIGGLLTFYTIHHLKPFNHPIVRIYYSVFTCINIWTAIYMMIALIVEKRIFSGIIFAWILTVPIIVVIVLWSPANKQKNQDNLYINVNKFATAEDVKEHCQYVIGLIILDIDKQQKGNLLNGYIEFHNKTCLQLSCPLKKVKFMSYHLRKSKGLIQITSKKVNPLFPMKESKNKDLRYSAVYDMILKLFEQGIAKFPLSIPLRIYFIVFLSSIIKSRQHALAEIIETQNFKCSFDQTFLLFYLRRNIEHEIFLISQETSGENIQDKLQIESNFSHFKTQIEQVVMLLLEFWSQLGEDKPDISKLLDIGTRIFPLKLQVDVSWRKLSRFSGESFTKILRIYSKYLIIIFGDYQKGNELALKAVRLDNALNDKKNQTQNIVQNILMDGIEDGMILITLEDERLGVITQVNQALVNQFGYYSKSELNFKNVSNLMPAIFSTIHDEILSKYKLLGEQFIMGGERILLGKSKYSLITPISIIVRPVYNQLKDAIEIFAVIRKERSLKHIAYVICNNKGIINDFSASSLNILGLDQLCLCTQEVNVENIVSDFPQNIENYEQKNGQMIKYIPPLIEEGQLIFSKGSQQEKRKIYEIELNVVIQTCKIHSLNQIAGYIFKFELINKKPNKVIKKKYAQTLESTYATERSQNVFQFKLLIREMDLKFYGERYEGAAYKDIIDNSFQVMPDIPNEEINYENLLLATNSNIIMIKSQHQTIIDQEIQVDRMSVIKNEYIARQWGEGYKIVRWQNGNFFEVEKDDSEQGSDAEQVQNEVEKRSVSRQKETLERDRQPTETGFHGAKDLNEILQKQKESNTVSVLRYFSIFVVFVMLGIAIINYAIKVSQIGQEKEDIQQIILSSRQISEIQLILSSTRELTLTNKHIRVFQYSLSQGKPPNKEDDEKELRRIMANSIKRLETITIEILKNQRLQSGDVRVYFNQEQYEIYDFGYATQQMLSKAHGILELPINQISQDQSDVFFLMHNGLNDYCKTLFDRYNKVIQLNFDNMVSILDLSVSILVISICIMIFFAIILTILLARTIITKQIILSSFLDISEQTTKMLYQKCENFLLELNFEEEQLISDNDLDGSNLIKSETEAGKEKTSIFGKKRKKFKNSDTKNLGFLLKMMMISIFIESFFVINNIFGTNQVFIMNELLIEFNATSIAEPYYSMTLNAEYQYALDRRWTVFNEPPLEFIPVMINNIYDIDGTLHREHAKNTEYHNNSAGYLDSFDSVYFQDACQIVVQFRDAGIVQCNQFGSGIVTQGMITVVIRYFQLLRYTRDRLAWINDYPNTTFVFDNVTYQVVNLSEIIQINNMYNMVRLSDTYELSTLYSFNSSIVEIQTVYLKSTLRFLQDNFLQEMNFIFDGYLVQRILILILFIVATVIAYIIYWAPYLRQLNDDIWSTKCLLIFIPAVEISNIKSLAYFIKEFILEKKI